MHGLLQGSDQMIDKAPECKDKSHRGLCPRCAVPMFVASRGIYVCPKCHEVFMKHGKLTARYQKFLDHLRTKHKIDLWWWRR